jgi:hypothetical protein
MHMFPGVLQPFAQMLLYVDRMLLQSFGVSHMKLGAGADALLRWLMRVQSAVVPQLLGFARSTLLHRAVLFMMSWKWMKGL